MVRRFLYFLFMSSLLTACISGPPRDLRDEEVMWIELSNTSPADARALIVQSIETTPFGCRTNEYRNRIAYGCGRGPSGEDNQQVKGHCQPSPITPTNSVCDVFFLKVKVAGLFKSRYSQPEQPRETLEMLILKDTGATRIASPAKLRNSWYQNNVGLARLGDK